jgi:hypothetical protein
VSRSAGANSSRDQSSQRPGARTEPPVTRSMSRVGLGLISPVPEDKAKGSRCVPSLLVGLVLGCVAAAYGTTQTRSVASSCSSVTHVRLGCSGK